MKYEWMLPHIKNNLINDCMSRRLSGFITDNIVKINWAWTKFFWEEQYQKCNGELTILRRVGP